MSKRREDALKKEIEKEQRDKDKIKACLVIVAEIIGGGDTASVADARARLQEKLGS